MSATLRACAVVVSVVKAVPLVGVVGWFIYTSMTITFAGPGCELDDELCGEGLGLWVLFFVFIAGGAVLVGPPLVGQVVSALSRRTVGLAVSALILRHRRSVAANAVVAL